MNLSHLSYSQDFDASTKDVDLLTKRSIESGALGCRLTGGGFGGFTVSLIEKKNYDKWYNWNQWLFLRRWYYNCQWMFLRQFLHLLQLHYKHQRIHFDQVLP